mmetsp:Transcript_19187/g.31060  ORF Transcript_19187/g.31060 Transcript_19187/m.31060 type:complete len:204 (-) Transcript_19187:243-854(-)
MRSTAAAVAAAILLGPTESPSLPPAKVRLPIFFPSALSAASVAALENFDSASALTPPAAAAAASTTSSMELLGGMRRPASMAAVVACSAALTTAARSDNEAVWSASRAASTAKMAFPGLTESATSVAALRAPFRSLAGAARRTAAEASAKTLPLACSATLSAANAGGETNSMAAARAATAFWPRATLVLSSDSLLVTTIEAFL